MSCACSGNLCAYEVLRLVEAQVTWPARSSLSTCFKVDKSGACWLSLSIAANPRDPCQSQGFHVHLCELGRCIAAVVNGRNQHSEFGQWDVCV